MKAVFFDRDGTLIKGPEPPPVPENITLFPDTLESLEKLKRAGYLLFVISNQPDAAKGKNTLENVSVTCAAFDNLIKFVVKKVYYCFHKSEDNCVCRKPQPYFILKAQKDYDLDLSQSWMVGDSDKDIKCGSRAGVKTIRVLTGNKGSVVSDYTANDLSSAVDIILGVENDN